MSVGVLCKRLLLLSCAFGLLCSCESGVKVKTIEHFTPRFAKEKQDFKSLVCEKFGDSPQYLDEFYGPNFVNTSSPCLQAKNFGDYIQSLVEANSRAQTLKSSGTARNQVQLKTKSRFVPVNFLSSDVLVSSIVVNKAGVAFGLTNNNNVFAYNIESKKLLWKTNINTNYKHYPKSGGIVFDGSRIYITNGSQDVVALNISTGYEVYRTRMLDIVLASPTIDDNLIYVITSSNHVVAINKNNGSITWMKEGDSDGGLIAETEAHPMIYGKYIVAGYNNGPVAFLDKSNAQQAFSIPFDDNQYQPEYSIKNLACQPVIHNGVIYVANNVGSIVAVDLRSGQLLWNKSVHDVHAMNRVGNIVVVVTNAGQAIALDITSGATVWATDVFITQNNKMRPTKALTPFVVSSNVVLLFADGSVCALDPDSGDIIGRGHVGQSILGYVPYKSEVYLVTPKGLMVPTNK